MQSSPHLWIPLAGRSQHRREIATQGKKLATVEMENEVGAS